MRLLRFIDLEDGIGYIFVMRWKNKVAAGLSSVSQQINEIPCLSDIDSAVRITTH